MPLIVKIMSDDNFADDSPYKAHSLITGVISLRFLLTNGGSDFDPGVMLYFGRGEEPEYHHVHNNVYVMNENGKTISSWAVPVEIPVTESLHTAGDVVCVSLGLPGLVPKSYTLLNGPYKGRKLMYEFGVGSHEILETEIDNGHGPTWCVVLPEENYFPHTGQRFRVVRP